jgi:Zn-dependent M28 family amino/carboxypeptidase
VILVADSTADAGIPFYATNARRGTYGIDSAGGEHRPRPQTPVLLARSSMLQRLRGAARLSLALSTESFVYPSVNVVAIARGSDAQLRKEYVLFSSHQDHDGVRTPVNGDSIWNGADDNATTSVAILAIGRGWARRPGKRSALFVWHGAEERGLLGSRWHAAHPVVPRSSIVAVLNADMIGRGHPDSAALLGVQPPHRNSTRLAEAALRANDLVSRFRLDTLWDRPDHPEGWYFRSDHLPYARAGVPAVFFSTLLHPDYHTPRDEPRTIDVVKMVKVARWMYMTGWLVSQDERRPEVDAGFKLER